MQAPGTPYILSEVRRCDAVSLLQEAGAAAGIYVLRRSLPHGLAGGAQGPSGAAPHESPCKRGWRFLGAALTCFLEHSKIDGAF